MIRTDDGLLRFASFEPLLDLRHAFAPADAFRGHDAARAADRRRLQDAVLPNRRLVETHQTHSAHVAVVTATTSSGDLAAPERAGIDALVTRERGALLHAIAADCPLLYLVDADAGAIGLAHCGWKGTVAGIVGATIGALVDVLGARRERVRAAIAPGAGGCCYEVGPEVIARFAALGLEPDSIARPSARDRHAYLDLRTALVRLLAREGVDAPRTEVACECTICGGSRFHSHRRAHGKAGRMSGVIGLAAASAD